MKYVKADILYDGTGMRKNVYVGFDREITYVGEKKPEGEHVARGVVTPAFVDGHSHI